MSFVEKNKSPDKTVQPRVHTEESVLHLQRGMFYLGKGVCVM